jgi:hypothetical protein
MDRIRRVVLCRGMVAEDALLINPATEPLVEGCLSTKLRRGMFFVPEIEESLGRHSFSGNTTIVQEKIGRELAGRRACRQRRRRLEN